MTLGVHVKAEADTPLRDFSFGNVLFARSSRLRKQ